MFSKKVQAPTIHVWVPLIYVVNCWGHIESEANYVNNGESEFSRLDLEFGCTNFSNIMFVGFSIFQFQCMANCCFSWPRGFGYMLWITTLLSSSIPLIVDDISTVVEFYTRAKFSHHDTPWLSFSISFRVVVM